MRHPRCPAWLLLLSGVLLATGCAVSRRQVPATKNRPAHPTESAEDRRRTQDAEYRRRIDAKAAEARREKDIADAKQASEKEARRRTEVQRQTEDDRVAGEHERERKQILAALSTSAPECDVELAKPTERRCFRLLVQEELAVTISGGSSFISEALNDGGTDLASLHRLSIVEKNLRDAPSFSRCPKLAALSAAAEDDSIPSDERKEQFARDMKCYLSGLGADIKAWRAGKKSEIGAVLRPIEQRLAQLESLQEIDGFPALLITNGPKIGAMFQAGPVSYALEVLEPVAMEDGTLVLIVVYLVENVGRPRIYIGMGADLYLRDINRVMVRETPIGSLLDRYMRGERIVDEIPRGARARRAAAFAVTRQMLDQGLELVVPDHGTGKPAMAFGLRYVE